jgi:ribonuclease J
VREREALARDGFVLVHLVMDRNTCVLTEQPEIITRGFIYQREEGDLLAETRKLVEDGVRCGNGNLQKDLEQSVKSFLYSKTKRRPMVFITMIQA